MCSRCLWLEYFVSYQIFESNLMIVFKVCLLSETFAFPRPRKRKYKRWISENMLWICFLTLNTQIRNLWFMEKVLPFYGSSFDRRSVDDTMNDGFNRVDSWFICGNWFEVACLILVSMSVHLYVCSSVCPFLRPFGSPVRFVCPSVSLSVWTTDNHWTPLCRGAWWPSGYGFEGRGIDPRLRSLIRRSIASLACLYGWNKAPLTVEADNTLTWHWQESYTKWSSGMAQCGGSHGLSENQMPIHAYQARVGSPG